MVVVIIMLLILFSLIAAYSLFGKTETASTQAATTSNTGFYAAEAGLNMRAKQIQDKFQGYNRPSGISPGTASNAWQNCIDADTANDGTGDLACNVQTFNNQKLVTYVVENPTNDATYPLSITIPSTDPFPGLSAQEYRYDVTSVALNSQDLPSAVLTMRFKSRLVPMFQFVVFYNNDADFTIPPNMTLNGPVHSNGDLYLNASSSSTLAINGSVTTAGTLYRGEKMDSSCSGTVNILVRLLSCGSGRTAYAQNTTTPSNISNWNNQVRIGVPSLTIPQPGDFDPTPGKLYWDKADLRVALKLNSSGNPTGIEIRNQDNTVTTGVTSPTYKLLNSCFTTSTTLRDKAVGNPYYLVTDTQLKVNSVTGFSVGDVINIGSDYDSNVISAIDSINKIITLKRQLGNTATTGNTVGNAIVSTSDTFYNYREKNGGSGADAGSYIRMLNVDVQGLLNCVYSQNLMGKTLDDNTDGGLIWFLTVDGPNSNTNVNNATSPNTPNNYAVRLYNGKYLYSTLSGAPDVKGLTIVSDQAAYIQGDYNVKTADPLARWKPAAILADTINVLSNAWLEDDSNGRGYSLANLPSTTVPLATPNNSSGVPNPIRTANATIINAGFLSGTNITGGVNGIAGQGGASSGGVNNYPRFHEYWTGKSFQYRGSFVSLNQPRRVNSPFCGSLSTAATCNIYSPPTRNWDFDTDFNDAGKLPPLTPRAVYLRQEVFSRNFDR